MLAGGYSKHYKTMEKSKLETLKEMAQIDKYDSIARARRLSQETNKRRKQQILKRKAEAQREEKRRQEILSRRRDEQRKATERFQRANIPNSRPGSRRNSPQRANTDEALKLIRGMTPSYMRQNSDNKKMPPRAFSSNNYTPDSRGRPQSGSQSSSQQDHAANLEYAMMMNRSFRNMTSSRNLFETQLKYHQQLLLEDQKKALHQFNEAIMNEIEGDRRVQGVMDIDSEMVRSESLSSIDSLDAAANKEKSNGSNHISSQTVAPSCSSQPEIYSSPIARVEPTGFQLPNENSENRRMFVLSSDGEQMRNEANCEPLVHSQMKKLEEVIHYHNCGDIDSPSSLNSSYSFMSNHTTPNNGLSNRSPSYPNSPQVSHVSTLSSTLPAGFVVTSTQNGHVLPSTSHIPQSSASSGSNIMSESSSRISVWSNSSMLDGYSTMSNSSTVAGGNAKVPQPSDVPGGLMPHSSNTSGSSTLPHSSNVPGGIMPHSSNVSGGSSIPHSSNVYRGSTMPHSSNTSGGRPVPHSSNVSGGSSMPHSSNISGGSTTPHLSNVSGGSSMPHSSNISGGSTTPHLSNVSGGSSMPHSSNISGGSTTPHLSNVYGGSHISSFAAVSGNTDSQISGTLNYVTTNAANQASFKDKFQPGSHDIASHTSNQIGKMNKLFSDVPLSTSAHYSSILAAHATPVIPTSTTTTTYVIGPRQLASRNGSSHPPVQAKDWINLESSNVIKDAQISNGQTTKNGETVHTSDTATHTQNIASGFTVPSVTSSSLTADCQSKTAPSQSAVKGGNTGHPSTNVNCKTVAHSIKNGTTTFSIASNKPVVSMPTSKTADTSNRSTLTTNAQASSGTCQSNLTTGQFSGCLTKGTLGLVNGKLTVLTNDDKCANSENDACLVDKPPKPIPVSETESDPESGIRSILKKPHLNVLKKAESTGSLNIKDSLELTRNHLKENSAGHIDSVPKKKSVRFIDFEVNSNKSAVTEDSEPENKQVDQNIKILGTSKGTPKPKTRTRIISMKATNPSKQEVQKRIARAAISSSSQTKAAHVDVIQHAKDRPKAAAHIITHSTEGTQLLQHQDGNSRQAEQNEKRVRVVSNNFMEKVPIHQSSAVMCTSQQAVGYTGTDWSQRYSDEEYPDVKQKEENAYLKYTTAPSVSVRQNPGVYNENGLRIDRTPTDDEINSLWEKVRTCLDTAPTGPDRRGHNEGPADPNGSKYIASVSNKYFDGTSLGITSNSRSGYNYSGAVQQRIVNNGSSVKQRPATNGYLRRYGLLQQRRIGSGRTPMITQQDTAQINPVISHQEPQPGTSYQTKDDVTDSLMSFVAAEKLASQSTTNSQMQAAFDERHRKRVLQIKHSPSNPGPSALSLEEQKLLESLDRLNEKLKINESGYPTRQVSQPVTQPQQNVFVHNVRVDFQAFPEQYVSQQSSGFRGHQPYQTNQFRPQSGYSRPTAANSLRQKRVQSARQYY